MSAQTVSSGDNAVTSYRRILEHSVSACESKWGHTTNEHRSLILLWRGVLR